MGLLIRSRKTSSADRRGGLLVTVGARAWDPLMTSDQVLQRLAEARVAGADPSRSLIPEQADHPFRRKPITDSGASRSLNA
jgi:hypothetical protein